jgi:hypothetical protein
MALGAVFVEWLNANASRNYPIIEGLSRKDVSGNFTLPNDLIVSAQLNFSREEVVGGFFVSEVGSFNNSCYISIGYEDEIGNVHEVSKIDVDYSSHTPNQYYSFVGQGAFSHVVGYLCINNTESLGREGFGVFNFSKDSTSFEPNCLFVSIPALKSVELYSGGSLLHIANDVLRLKAGKNIRLSYVDGEDPNNKAIKIDAIAGLNLDADEDSCSNNNFITKTPIKTINGIPPDEFGNFNIIGSDCIDIKEEPNGVSIHDMCSESCCGCDELDTLVSALEQLRAQEESIRTIINSIEAQQSALISKLTSGIM